MAPKIKFFAGKAAAKEAKGKGDVKPKDKPKEQKKPEAKPSVAFKPKPTPAFVAPQRPPVKMLDADTALDILGGFILLISVVTIFLALSSTNSELGGAWLTFLRRQFGWGVYLAPIVMALVGIYLLIRRFGSRFPRFKPFRMLGVLLAYLCGLATLHVVGMFSEPNADALAAASKGGGAIGNAILKILESIAGNIGAPLLLLALWIVALLMISGWSVAQLTLMIQSWFGELARGSVREVDRRIIEAQQNRERRRSDEVDRGDGMVIRGLNFGRQKQKAGSSSQVDIDDESELEVELPPARDVNAKPAPTKNSDAIIEPGTSSQRLTINQPKPRTSEVNRVPAPRIIGQVSNASHEPSRTSEVQSPVTQPAPTQISSRIQIQRDWQLPKIEEVLELGNDANLKEADIRARAGIIEDTLRAFGVPGRVTEVNRGPTITQFGVEPGFIEMKGGKTVKVKVSRIAALADDLALALAAPRIRIEAPVPGRGIVGIEVPNGETSLVSLRDVIESEEFENLQRKSRVRLALGQDVSGRPVVADLSSMPHMLIAGTTGSGKSVCVNSIITALLCYNSPEDLRLLMIDPKRVELTGYNGIPHLIAPVVVDVEKTPQVLQWVAREMDTRYRTFAKFNTRNIVDYNAKVAAEAERQSSKEGGRLAEDSLSSFVQRPSTDSEMRKLPYIVVVIDELADLMMMAPDETEKTICRLAQMARATGIHLIIATQRPSVDVVTGLIKANFPARIAFTVATAVDSRVILDGPGAEKLLGRGDMLVVTPESAMPMRAQGCFLSDKEINRVVRHWRGQLGEPLGGLDPITAATTAPEVPMKGTLEDDRQEPVIVANNDPFGGMTNTWDEARALKDAADDGGNKDDKLFNDAVATVRMHGKASISLLQRRLRIGYSRAARIIEEMEERGIVGPSVPGQQHREVLNSPLDQ